MHARSLEGGGHTHVRALHDDASDNWDWWRYTMWRRWNKVVVQHKDGLWWWWLHDGGRGEGGVVVLVLAKNWVNKNVGGHGDWVRRWGKRKRKRKREGQNKYFCRRLGPIVKWGGTNSSFLPKVSKTRYHANTNHDNHQKTKPTIKLVSKLLWSPQHICHMKKKYTISIL